MVFSSITFLYFFLPLVLLVYFSVPMKGKNIVLLVSGLIFYAWGEPFYVIIMVISTAIDYTAGRLIDKYDDDQKKRMIFLIISVCMNLSLLVVFKYSSFIISNINELLGIKIFDPKLPLPIGISFYTFQSMSYTIDLYLRKIKVQKSIINFTTYVTLFPQIVAGPIVRYQDVQGEIDKRQVNVTKLTEGIGLFVKGLGKKVLIANQIGMVWDTVKVMDYSQISVLTAWVGILSFTFQIYFDFSGYSDMAVGLGKMLGFNFPQNFNYPYTSKSISEFWRRWHITLGSWFKSYVYIPLGGNHGGLVKTIRNLLIVWLLTGFWHGASWNFIVWGLYFGLLIILEKLWLGKVLENLPEILSRTYTFVLVVISWVFFDTKSLADSFKYILAMFGANRIFIDSSGMYLFTSNIIIFIVCILTSTELVKRIYLKLASFRFNIMAYLLPLLQAFIIVLCTAYLVESSYNPFLYFRF